MMNTGFLPMRHFWNNKLSVGNGSGWTYSSKMSHCHIKPGPKLEFSRTTEERKAKDDLEKDSGEEAGKAGKAWKEVRALAQNRVCWHCFVEALCSGQE
jgi:hypothetical protein